MKLTLLLGGAVFDYAMNDRPEILLEYAEVVSKALEEGYRVTVVAGGGKLARNGIRLVRSLGAGNSLQDGVGIAATRFHALLMIAALGERAYPSVPTTYEEFKQYYESGKVVVSGGMVPGQSTDAVAAVITEMVGGRLVVKGTGVEGVRKIKEDGSLGEIIPRLTYRELENVVMKNEQSPGKYELLDMIALRVLWRSGIKLIIYNGLRPTEFERILRGERTGTVVEGAL